ncbi:MAG: hypothetical protein KBF93_15145 [Leptospiraceae bacterium]|nr:hypothetical protein [Leptospiraceae bacterium]
MNESHIKIEIDEELLEDYTSGFYEESFESINENFFTLKRFNLVCEKVYDRVSAENGIFSYIIAYVREYLSFYERNDIIIEDCDYNIFTPENSSSSSFWIFSMFKKNRLFIKNSIKRLTEKDVSYKFQRGESDTVLITLIILSLSLGGIYIKYDGLARYFFLISSIVSCIFTFFYFLDFGRIRIPSHDYLKSVEDYYKNLILILFHFKKIEINAIKRKEKRFHLLLSFGNYSNYDDADFQKNFADLIYEFILRNDNLSITINNSHPVFLTAMLSNYQKGIADAANGEYPLKNEFTMIQSYDDPSLKEYFEDEEENSDFLEEDEDDYPILKSVRFINFPDTGNLPLSFAPISSEDYAVERSADKLVKTKLDITKSLATELSHEIRNPIGVIQLIAENILSGKIENTEDQKLYLRDILKQTDRIDEVLRYFSSIETNRKNGSKELNINKIILDAFHFFQEQLESNSVHVEYQLDQALPTIHGVSESLGNVIVNLIRNSIYALNGKENKKILVRTFMESDTIKIEVTDNGCGIDSNDRAKIFRPFFTTKSSGSGIGLWLSHRAITEEFGGKFTFTSEVNAGTTFFISLPIERERT